MQSTMNINNKRKFHDAWAFILYLIVTIGCTSYTLFSFDEKSFDNNFTTNDYKILTSCFTIVGVFLFVNFFCLRFLPKIYLKFTLALYPLIIFAGLFMANFSVPSIILSFITLMFWAFFIYKYWKTIPLISLVISSAVKILLSRIFSVTSGVMFCCTFLCLQFILFGISLSKDLQNKSLVLTLLFFNFSWSISNILYFYKVYITSIVAFHLIESSDTHSGVFLNSLKNSLYALGSISFAGLLIAIVETLRFLVNNERNDNERERNALKEILLCIVSILLSILQNFIEMANELTLPYVAIHGTNYVKSMKNSYDLLQKGDIRPFLGTVVLNYMLSFMFMITAICCGIVSFLLIDKKTQNVSNLLLANGIPLLFYLVWTMVFSASYLSIIYLFADRPILIKDNDERLYDNLQILKSI